MIAFRDIGDDDIDAVIALWQACGLTRPWNDPVKDIAFARAGAASTVLIGEADGMIAASVMVGHDGHRGMLYYLAVAPDYQRRGLGKLTLKAAEDWLAARGVWKINLLVRAENDRVRGFYERMGYEVNPVLCMARRIAPQNG
jgi:ribosomal protein S18 acetylase RimI-like enzyme